MNALRRLRSNPLLIIRQISIVSLVYVWKYSSVTKNMTNSTSFLVTRNQSNIQPWIVLNYEWVPASHKLWRILKITALKSSNLRGVCLCLSICCHAIHIADCHYDLSFFPFFKVADIQNHIMPCYDPWHNETKKIEIEIFYKNLRLSSFDWFCF